MDKNNWYINYTSERIRNNHIIIKKLIEKNKFLFPIVQTELKKDKKFILEILKEYNIPLNYISRPLLMDMDILKTAILKNSLNFFYIPVDIYYNKKIIMNLYLTNKSISKYFTHSIHNEVLDEYNYKCFLFQKRKEDKFNIFHMEDLSFYISEFLFFFS